DREGALRFAAALFGLEMVLWLFETRHLPEFGHELQLFTAGFLRALLDGTVVWLFYVALEPYVRRFWPDALITWNRLPAGRYGDPRVGRDVLVGVAVIALWTATQSLLQWAAQGLGTPLPPRQQALTPDSLLGGRHVIAIVTHSAYFSLRSMWLFLMM